MILKRLAGLAIGTSLLFLPAGSASANYQVECKDYLDSVCAYIDAQTGGQCNGSAADVNCEYCSWNASSVASPNEYCDNGTANYEWTGCTVWVAAACAVG